MLSPQVDPASLPPLPEIVSDELRKQVFTHRSYHARPTNIFEDSADDPSPNNEAYVEMLLTCYFSELHD